MGDRKFVIRRDIESVQQRMEKMLDSIFDEKRPTVFSAEKVWKPPTDIYETAEEIIVIVEIAGMRKEDITVTIENNLLTVSGTRPDYSPSTTKRIHQMEIDHGKFERIIDITIPLDTEHSHAHYKEGFLRIAIPKMQERQARKVEMSREE